MHFDAKHRWMKNFDSESANHIGCNTEEGEKGKKDARRYAMVCDRLNLNSCFFSIIFAWMIVQTDTMGLARRVELEFLFWKFVRVSDVLHYERADFWPKVVGRSVWLCAGLAFSSSFCWFSTKNFVGLLSLDCSSVVWVLVWNRDGMKHGAWCLFMSGLFSQNIYSFKANCVWLIWGIGKTSSHAVACDSLRFIALFDVFSFVRVNWMQKVSRGVSLQCFGTIQ